MKKINVSIIAEQVGKLIERYSNDEETQKAFCAEVEKRYFSTGKYRKDIYDVDEATAQSWRRQMPKLTRDHVVPLDASYDKTNNITLVIVGFMTSSESKWQNFVPGTTGQALSELYTDLIDKVISELYSMPELIALNPCKICNGDGDEGCVYFEFKDNCDVEL